MSKIRVFTIWFGIFGWKKEGVETVKHKYTYFLRSIKGCIHVTSNLP